MALSTGEQVRWWLVGFLVFVAFLWVMSDVLLPFIAGAALAYFLDPVADRLQKRGLGRVAATAVVTLLMASAFVLLLVVLVPAIINQIRSLVEQLPIYADAVQAFVSERFPEQLEEGAPIAEAIDNLRRRADEIASQALRSAWSGGLALVDFVTLMVVTPVVAFYLLLDWDRMTAAVDSWIPRDHLHWVRGLARDIDGVLAGFVRGQLTVCCILGAFYATALLLVGLDFGLAIGLFAGLISFIPFVGAIVGGALSIGVALFQFWGQPEWIAAVVAVFAIGQAVEGNFLTPKLVGGSVGLHPVALIFALSAFGAVLGFTGMLIAVPTAAAIGVLGRFAVRQYKAGRLYQGRAWRNFGGAPDTSPAEPAPDPPGEASPGGRDAQ